MEDQGAAFREAVRRLNKLYDVYKAQTLDAYYMHVMAIPAADMSQNILCTIQLFGMLQTTVYPVKDGLEVPDRLIQSVRELYESVDGAEHTSAVDFAYNLTKLAYAKDYESFGDLFIRRWSINCVDVAKAFVILMNSYIKLKTALYATRGGIMVDLAFMRRVSLVGIYNIVCAHDWHADDLPAVAQIMDQLVGGTPFTDQTMQSGDDKFDSIIKSLLEGDEGNGTGE